jgi:hypothetical protein
MRFHRLNAREPRADRLAVPHGSGSLRETERQPNSRENIFHSERRHGHARRSATHFRANLASHLCNASGSLSDAAAT